MRGCQQIIAGVTAVFFVITAVAAFFLVNLAQGLTDRENIKAALNLEPLVRQMVPALMSDALRRSAAEQGLAFDSFNEATLDAAFDTVIPPGYIDDLTGTAVDGLYDYLESGDPDQAVLTLDVQPILNRLQGEPGQQAALALVQSLPPCEQPLSPEQLQAGQLDLNNCLPPNVPAETVALTLHEAVVAALNENPQVVGSGTIRINLFNTGQMDQAQLAQIQQVQRTFVLLQRWSWTLWFLPLFSLALIFTLVVRSASLWGHWWGWPLLLAGLITLILAAMVPAVLLVYSRTAVTLTADGGLSAVAISRRLAQSLTDLWLRRVLIQAGIMTFIGFAFVVLGFVGSRGAESHAGDGTF
jgi:hypothetical protein